MPARSAAVIAGLQRLGYSVEPAQNVIPGPRDILVTWNRIREGHPLAKLFEREGCKVLVMENATWGNDFLARHWYTLGLGYHNRDDSAPYGGPERWAALGFPLEPWRDGHTETVILPQRGIGPPAVAMPLDWPAKALRRYGGRVRTHPGQKTNVKPLHVDLRNASRVITWGSGAAVKALMWGIPVVSEMPQWIGAQDNTYAGRLRMLQRLAWAQWELKEFEDGSAFAFFLNR